MTPVAQSPRLFLRHVTAADIDVCAAFLADPRVMWDYLSIGLQFPDPRELVERATERYRDPGYGFFGVTLKTDNRVIGLCGLLDQEIDGRPDMEVGYRLAHEHWGNGYATEAARAVRDYAFVDRGADRVISIVRPDNIASCRIAEKNGMRMLKVTSWAKVPMAVRLYAIGRAEWEARRGMETTSRAASS